MRKPSTIFAALTGLLGHHSIESLTKQIRSTIGSRPSAIDAASGRRLLGALIGGRRETETLMRRLTSRRSTR